MPLLLDLRDMSELEERRNDLKRYTALHLWMGDAAMREHLAHLIEETQARIVALETDHDHSRARLSVGR